MKKILLLAAGAVVLLSDIASAEDSPDLSYILPPKPPYVARTAQVSAWTIEFIPGASTGSSTPTPGPGGATPPPTHAKKQLKQQDWTKSGSLIRCVNQWSDGSTTEDWVVGAIKLSQDTEQKGIHLYSGKLNPQYHDFSTSDFEMLDWITPKSYDHAVKHGTEVCYQFTAKLIASTSADPGLHNKSLAEVNAPTSPTTVIISVQSKLPLELDNGDGKYIYHYLPAPTGELKLPDAFAKLLKAYGGN